MEFRDAVKHLRSELGLTQIDLAGALHVTPLTIVRWEKGQNIPNRSLKAAIIGLARGGGVSEECLEALRDSLANAVKVKLGLSGDALFSVEHSSLRQLVDDAAFPIYVCDMDTDEILYLNQKACAMVGGDAPVIGQLCYKCLMHRDTPCEFCHKNELTDEHFTCCEVMRPLDNATYKVQGKRIRWNGHDAHVRCIIETDSGNQLKSIVEKMNGGVSVAVYDDDGGVRLAYANGRYYGLFGYTKEQFLKELKNPHDVLCPEDYKTAGEAISGVKNTGKPATFAYRVRKRDGSIAFISCSSSMSAVPGLGDRVLISVLTDITASVEAEEQLRSQQTRMTKLMNETPGGIAVIEADRRDIFGTLKTTYYNDSFLRYSGYTREEYDRLLQSNQAYFVFDEDFPVLKDATERVFNGDIGETESCAVRCHTKDGGYRWLLLTCLLVGRHGDICTVNVVQVDITLRKAAEDRQRINEEMLRLAAETDKRALITYDVKANTCHVESRTLYAGHYGETIPDIPRSLIERRVVAPDSASDLCAMFESIRSGKERVTAALQLNTGEGEYEWFECNAAAVFDADGKPDHAVLVFHNITEQRIKEAVFRKWQQSIEARPAESYTLFRCNLSKDAGLDERDGDLLKVEFSSDEMSFNSRTRAYAEQLVYPEDRGAYVSLLDSDSLIAMFYRDERVKTLEYREINESDDLVWRRLTVELVEYISSSDVQAFLLYEDIDEAKRAEIEAKELAETDPLTGALNRAAFAGQADSIIRENMSARNALLMLDMDGFKQLNDTFGHSSGDQALQDVVAVLRSYIRNGDLVCRLGGDEFLILLRNTPYDAVIGKTAQQMCEHIRKSYSSDVSLSASIGIAVYPRDGRDFDELYRNADKALYKAKQSKKGEYAFFSVIDEIQTDEIAEALSEVRKAPQFSRRAGRRILIVDDNEMNRVMLGRLFQNDFIIETASNGAEAMIRLRHFGQAISVVLLDIVMPGMDGFAVLRKMQNNVDMSAIPVVVVSGSEDRETVLKAVELGAADYVTKPVDPDLIRIRVQSAISKSENERLRAQNSYLQYQRDAEVKYRTVLDSTGTVVIEYDWRNHVFIYDSEISKHIAGTYDHRGLWQVFLSDMIADSADVKLLQEALLKLANKGEKQFTKLIRLQTPENVRHWFRLNIYKREDDYGLAEKLILTFNDVQDEVLANEKLLYQATRDELTGLYNRAGFLEKAAELIGGKELGYYVLSCIDIEKFKVINDQYGTEKGDAVLRHVAGALAGLCHGEDGICGRINADNFAVLLPADMLDSTVLEASRKETSGIDSAPTDVRFYVGRCVVDDKELPVSAIYDRAVIAKSTVKGRYDACVATFNESMRTEILRQQEITGQMNHALVSGQFEVWLQPQFNHATGMLYGAEALVRWRHPAEGIIAPGEFIPVFERNGFIYELDKYVWEQTCGLLRKWLDSGLNPVPVSVNVSRYDVFRDDLIETVTGLVAKYSLPVDLLRLEITESAFTETSGQIISVVKEFVRLGYIVEIDDFGSGYSSLNTLKDVPAQVIKMDMRFLENDDNAQRGGSIIESVVRMARWLGMSVIAEGVETTEQADYLKSIGCEYVQGYLYSRPTQASEYEKLFEAGAIESRLSRIKTVETWNNNAFWNPKSMETLIFNSYVGGACIFEYTGGKTELLRYNSSYAEIFGDNFRRGNTGTHNDILAAIDAESAEAVRMNLETAIRTKKESTCEIRITGAGSGSYLYIRITVRQIAQAGERHLFYCVVSDITAQRTAEQEKVKSTAQLQVIMDNMGGGVAASVVRNGKIHYLFANDRYYALLGYRRDEYNSQFTGEFNAIHPEDRERTNAVIRRAVKDGKPYSVDFRIIRKDGVIRWVSCSINIISLPYIDEPVHLAAVSDTTELHLAQQKQNEISDKLREILNSAENGVTAVILRGDKAEFVLANDKYYEIHGISGKSYGSGDLSDTVKLVHPEDRARMRQSVLNTAGVGQRAELEYRIVRPDGAVRWLKAVIRTVRITGVDAPVQVTVFIDITAQKDYITRLQYLNDSAHDILMQADTEQAIEDTLRKLISYHCADRGYVVELNHRKMLSYNTYEVCADGVTHEKDKLQALPFSRSDFWYESLNHDKFCCIENTGELPDDCAGIRALLAAQGIRSIILAPLYTDGVLTAFAGLDNPRVRLREDERLSAMSDYISILLNRRDVVRKREHDSRTILSLTGGTPGGFVSMKILDDGSVVPEYFNESYYADSGYTREEYTALTEKEPLALIPEEDRPAFRKFIADIIQSKKDGMTGEYLCRLRIKGGGTRPVKLRAVLSCTGVDSCTLNIVQTDTAGQIKAGSDT